MLNSLNKTNTAKNEFLPKFFRVPIKFSGQKRVEKITLGITKLTTNEINSNATLTDAIEEVPCDLVIRSIGYKSVQADNDLPFDFTKGVIKNINGKSTDSLYTAGWVSTGPTGVILTTMSNSFSTADAICNYIKNNKIVSKPGFEMIRCDLRKSGSPVVRWSGWEKIDDFEQKEGQKVGKPREKIVDVTKMLEIGGEVIS